MKNFRKLITLCLALMLCLSCASAAFAAEVADATIDEDALCSLTIWKFDFTNAMKDGVWNEDSGGDRAGHSLLVCMADLEAMAWVS